VKPDSWARLIRFWWLTKRTQIQRECFLPPNTALIERLFFIVEHEDQPTQVYTVYLKFVKEILAEHISEAEEIQDIMDTNPDLDFI
jgi:hypothetical protein